MLGFHFPAAYTADERAESDQGEDGEDNPERRRCRDIVAEVCFRFSAVPRHDVPNYDACLEAERFARPWRRRSHSERFHQRTSNIPYMI